MSQEIRANYEQLDLLPQCLEDWVPRDHPARFLREFVDSLRLADLGFRPRESEEGRPNYAADLLLKVWLYGYLAKIRSTRELERACREHLSLLWLTGRHTPDHNTLWRFWKENREALRAVFRKAVQVAAAQGLVGMICHAVDGTKIAAASSLRTMERRASLEAALERVEESIQAMTRDVEEAEEREAGEYRLPEELQEAEKLRAAIRASLDQMQEAERDCLHPQEPEARLMPCEGRKQLAYNAQVAVDEAGGLVVGEGVVNAEGDHHQLVPLLDEVKQNLGAVAEETVADAGYQSAPELARAEARGYEVLVNPTGEKQREGGGEFHAARFRYEETEDVVICPRGEKMPREREKWSRWKQYRLWVYRCEKVRECPMQASCSRDPRGRMIEIGPYHRAVEKQHAKQRDPTKQKWLQKRQGIVEPVFGLIKQAMGFRRWTVRGLENVRTQWSLVCTAYNLKKLYRNWQREVLALT